MSRNNGESDIPASELAMDCESASTIIVEFIKKKVQGGRKQGVLLGLSGGVDSALVATLAVKAIGPDKVHALYIFDRDNQRRSLLHAQQVAGKLGIDLKTIDMSRLSQEGAAFTRPPRVSPLPSFGNRIVFAMLGPASRIAFGQNPYLVALRRQPPEKGWFRKGLYRLIVERVNTGFDRKHRLRRAILEDNAQKNNLLLVGCANKSEAMVGWFVKDGVDDLPLEPILGLYKTQVRQLARCLDVPQEIVEQAPIPDMLKGLTDEMGIGHRYERLDIVLYVIEKGLAPEVAYRKGIKSGEFEDIKAINRLSAWKRESPHEYPNIS